MPLFLSLLLTFLMSAPAFADEVLEDKTPAEAVRAEWRANLAEVLVNSRQTEKNAVSACGDAKRAYRTSENELAVINVDLEAPVGDVLGDMRTKYVAKLKVLSKQEEANLTKSKSAAKKAGDELVAIRTKIKVVEAEIARIDTKVDEERQSHRPADFGSLGARRGDLNQGSFQSVGLTVSSHYAPKLAPLPAEFALCFPREVASPS